MTDVLESTETMLYRNIFSLGLILLIHPSFGAVLQTTHFDFQKPNVVVADNSTNDDDGDDDEDDTTHMCFKPGG